MKVETITITNPVKPWTPCDDRGPVVYFDKDFNPTQDPNKIRGETTTCSKSGSWTMWRERRGRLK